MASSLRSRFAIACSETDIVQLERKFAGFDGDPATYQAKLVVDAISALSRESVGGIVVVVATFHREVVLIHSLAQFARPFQEPLQVIRGGDGGRVIARRAVVGLVGGSLNIKGA